MHHPEDIDYSQPVAYDTNGRPLYAHPPKPSTTQNHAHTAHHAKDHGDALRRAVHIARAAEPVKQTLSPETIRKHALSQKRYPKLNLTEGEYVIKVIRRHPIGLLLPLGIGMLLIIMAVSLLVGYSSFFPSGRPTWSEVASPVFALIGIIALVIYVIAWVYAKNRLVLTNESIIQEMQSTPFAHHEQTVSLANIEDVSYTRHGVAQSLFDYGTVRMSTEGEETTYVFNYVAGPKYQTRVLHNAVEAFKNGRPFEDD